MKSEFKAPLDHVKVTALLPTRLLSWQITAIHPDILQALTTSDYGRRLAGSILVNIGIKAGKEV